VGKISGTELIPTLLLQGFWAVVMATIALLMMRAALHKVVVQGG
jgi:ABC-type uncharacterized transport system permease subunit